jgi:predicted flap endonuclease-1-like 5' DNA nuclease
MLHELGVTRFEQIASWSEADIDRIDSQLGRFKGRIRRDQWVEQAKLLVSGDKDAFEAKFGRGA